MRPSERCGARRGLWAAEARVRPWNNDLFCGRAQLPPHFLGVVLARTADGALVQVVPGPLRALRVVAAVQPAVGDVLDFRRDAAAADAFSARPPEVGVPYEVDWTAILVQVHGDVITIYSPFFYITTDPKKPSTDVYSLLLGHASCTVKIDVNKTWPMHFYHAGFTYMPDEDAEHRWVIKDLDYSPPLTSISILSYKMDALITHHDYGVVFRCRRGWAEVFESDHTPALYTYARDVRADETDEVREPMQLGQWLSFLRCSCAENLALNLVEYLDDPEEIEREEAKKGVLRYSLNDCYYYNADGSFGFNLRDQRFVIHNPKRFRLSTTHYPVMVFNRKRLRFEAEAMVEETGGLPCDCLSYEQFLKRQASALADPWTEYIAGHQEMFAPNPSVIPASPETTIQTDPIMNNISQPDPPVIPTSPETETQNNPIMNNLSLTPLGEELEAEDRVDTPTDRRAHQFFKEVRGDQKKAQTVELVHQFHHIFKEEHPDVKHPPRVLIFVRTKRDSDILAFYLIHNGIVALSLNSDRPQHLRKRTLDEFRKRITPTLVTTDLGSTAVEVNDLDFVLNMDLPDDIATYMRRVARTGPDNDGTAVSFFDPAHPVDRKLAPRIHQLLQCQSMITPPFIAAVIGKRSPSPNSASDEGFAGSSDYNQPNSKCSMSPLK